MKKTAVAAVALAGLTALTAASAAPATPITQAKAPHTLKWKLTETASHPVGKNGFVGADTIRSAKSRDIVGYDSFTGRFFPKTNSISLQTAFSVNGGILVGQMRGDFDSEPVVFRGPILKGTGKFQGAEGTIVAKLLGDTNKTLVTIRYQS